MKRPALYLTSFVLLFAASLAALGLSAAVDSPRSLMSPIDYAAGKAAIEATTSAAIERCRSANAATKDLCKAEARAEDRVQRAQLQARYLGTAAAAADVRQARVKARYDVARTRCDARSPNERGGCLKAARDERSRDLAGTDATAT